MTDLAFKLVSPDCIEIAGKRHRFYVFHGREATTVWFDGRTYYVPRPETNLSQHAGRSSSGEVSALMPGKLLRLEVSVGDTVAEKQPVAIMESMKMETTLYAPRSGRVSQVRCQPGQAIDMGEVVLVIDEAGM